MNKKSFDYKPRLSAGIIILLVLFPLLIVTTTIAFFYASDYANTLINMSGKVDILAVGDGDFDDSDSFSSIEDTYTSNLVVSLNDGYNVLIPGGDVLINANCKVFQSTTKPLLRAKLDFVLSDGITGLEVDKSNYLVLQLLLYHNHSSAQM